ncbi:isochorismatase family protein [Acetobacteraceae bacterium H6797]|nr:isochorismatase family protein [Acetobacteraceae bacterium H6797]
MTGSGCGGRAHAANHEASSLAPPPATSAWCRPSVCGYLRRYRHGVTTIPLGCTATDFGVESTAPQASEEGYDSAIVEDGCSGLSAELHEMAMKHIVPNTARVTSAAVISFG